jgi:hypothetical protein
VYAIFGYYTVKDGDYTEADALRWS